MPILDLATHHAPYVTVAELAEYWAVSRHQLHKHIESGSLAAIRLGSRLYRIRVQGALEFERQASVSSAERVDTSGAPSSVPERNEKLRARLAQGGWNSSQSRAGE